MYSRYSYATLVEVLISFFEVFARAVFSRRGRAQAIRTNSVYNPLRARRVLRCRSRRLGTKLCTSIHGYSERIFRNIVRDGFDSNNLIWLQ